MTIEEFRRYSDDEGMIERVEEYLKQVDEGGSCEGKYELAVLLESKVVFFPVINRVARYESELFIG